MTRSRLLATLATTSILVLGACGGSDGNEASPSTSATTSAVPSATPSTAKTTPWPTASTTAAPSAPSAPSGKLLTFSDGEGSGVMITSAADVSRLPGAPADFKAFIAREVENAPLDQGCTERARISVDTVDTGGWARGGTFVPQCGGYATLWAKSGGTWKNVWGGQSLTECSVLTEHRFPARVAGAKCLQGDDAVAYTG
jgi:hypothetical protein